ncbi:MAG: PTS sugar transporter subunit IIA [Spirochaetales bacterium]|nr:PTS sugar transporter subunit IIA [Spirochaetales bacterium]
MNQRVLQPEAVQIGASSQNKKGILEEITELCLQIPELENQSRKNVMKKFRERESIGSTGFGHGIAIPHIRLPGIDGFFIGALIDKSGFDFEALDKKPVHALFFIIGPENKRDEHIRLISELTRVLRDKDVVAKLIECKKPEEVSKWFLANVHTPEEKPMGPSSMVQFFVQDDSAFEEILRLTSISAEGTISVIETHNAGQYLHSMPVFAAFWNDTPVSFNRIIIAVIDSRAANELLRQISSSLDPETLENRVLITMQELTYVSGSISF